MRLLRAWQTATDLLYPPRCLVCARPPLLVRGPFCEACRDEIFHYPELACPRCAATVGPFGVLNGRCPECRSMKPKFDAAVRLGIYQGRLGEAVVKIKFASHEYLAEALGEAWADARAAELSALNADVLIPVPLHWRKRLARGYNQSGALAFALARKLGKPYRPRWLKRIRATDDQKAQTSFTARRNNVKDAFRAHPDARNHHVLLIDDVMTTGLTASEAAAALLQVGASAVTVAVLARTGG